MRRSKVLIVCEGDTEQRILESIKVKFFPKEADDFFIYAYGTHIHELAKKLEANNYDKNDKYDDDAKKFDLIKQILFKHDTSKAASKLPWEGISDIYFFFDLDAHDSFYLPDRIGKLLSFFSDATRLGKLFISYPMAEALYDFHDTPDDMSRTYSIIKGANYKESLNKDPIVARFRSKHSIEIETWYKLCFLNWRRAYTLLETNCDEFPSYKELLEIQQANIFQEQLKLHIEPNEEVLVLSAFPLFLLDYGFPADFLYDKVKALA